MQFFGAVTKSSPYMIVTEFMGCGSLADLFKDRVTLSTRRCVQLALECARGIAYLHNHHPLSIIHRWGPGGFGGLGGLWSGPAATCCQITPQPVS